MIKVVERSRLIKVCRVIKLVLGVSGVIKPNS